MKHMQRGVACSGLVNAPVAALSFLVAAQPAGADAGDVRQHVATKVARGAVNAATGWAEVPKTIYGRSVESDPVTGFFAGTIEGTGKAIWRTGAGRYEAGTFFVPLPSGHAPVTEPDTLFGRLR